MSKSPITIHPLLKPYIIHIDSVEAVQPLLPYKVYPGLSVVIGFQYQGSIAHLTRENNLIPLKPSGITGLLTNYRRFQNTSSDTKTILIRLYPWAIPVLFNESAFQLTEQSIGLSELMNPEQIRLIEERVMASHAPDNIISIIQEFLVQRLLTNTLSSQQRIIKITQELIANPTEKTVQEIANCHGYSTRSLERQFQTFIGVSPKKFMRISRFQKILHLIQQGGCWAKGADYLNYYDQSHFIKEFLQFTGLTPQQFSAQSRLKD